MDLYSNNAIRERAELLVRNEVHYCVSSLISTILQAPDTWRALGLDEDECYGLAECLDYEEPALQYIEDMARDDLADYLESQDVDPIVNASDSDLRALARAAMAEHGAREFCDEFNLEPDRADVYEHWVVSDWLARKLDEAGHPIARDFLGLTIWGRPTTGQGIALDSVILEIARECMEVRP